MMADSASGPGTPPAASETSPRALGRLQQELAETRAALQAEAQQLGQLQDTLEAALRVARSVRLDPHTELDRLVEELLEAARREADTIRAQAEEEVRRLRWQADEELTRERESAQAELTAMRARVESELAELRAQTEQELARLRARAEAELNDRRAAVERELAERHAAFAQYVQSTQDELDRIASVLASATQTLAAGRRPWLGGESAPFAGQAAAEPPAPAAAPADAVAADSSPQAAAPPAEAAIPADTAPAAVEDDSLNLPPATATAPPAHAGMGAPLVDAGSSAGGMVQETAAPLDHAGDAAPATGAQEREVAAAPAPPTQAAGAAPAEPTMDTAHPPPAQSPEAPFAQQPSAPPPPSAPAAGGSGFEAAARLVDQGDVAAGLDGFRAIVDRQPEHVGPVIERLSGLMQDASLRRYHEEMRLLLVDAYMVQGDYDRAMSLLHEPGA